MNYTHSISIREVVPFNGASNFAENFTFPFSSVKNNYEPNTLWGNIQNPYPTNKWWMNFALEGGDEPIGCLPYIATASIEGVSFFYPQPSVSNTSVTLSTMSEWDVGSREGFLSRQVSSFDDMTMIYSWTSKENSLQGMSTPLVKGSPYFTIKYNDSTPLFKYNNAAFTSATHNLSKTSFKFTFKNGRIWGIYATSPINIFFTETGELISDQTYSGYIRFAYFPDKDKYEEYNKILEDHKYAVPVGANISFSDDKITHNYRLASTNPKRELLMLCLPHHLTLLKNINSPCDLSGYVTLKGKMTPVVANTWSLVFDNPNKIDFKYSKSIPEEKKAEILQALNDDIKHEDPINQSTSVYFRGKELSRMARLALIANEVGDTGLQNTVLDNLKENIEYWLDSKIKNPLKFDETWGGICSSDSLANADADFGNSRYNDHHFHYGYFIYSASVLIKLSPDGNSWYNKYKPSLDALVGDYASLNNNPLFTTFRHMDFYDGHSWASGLYVFGLNRNQESVSEAVNAYYAAYLFALATNDTTSASKYNLLLSSEIISAQYYFQSQPDSGVYDNTFAQNYIVGILWETSAQYTTWFGNNPEFIYGIQMLPFTPISFSLFDKTWLHAAWPTIKTRTLISGREIEDGWKGFMLMAGSIVEKDKLISQIRSLKGYDNGNSKTNALWWASVC
ncbi:hypothetical protein BB561_004115 [Smittium simulii]|uniref:glucan endo-1,3-beta-D-glucosidase n=1 Tax=Smittium simulii TaxID=133385 RepID=A0A2T9YHV3_9FUNG|nr:hypothetical protein BB561_004115 [Smittium simulii]